MKLYCDNKSATDIVDNPIQHDCAEHIKIDNNFTKEKLDNWLVAKPYVSSKNQLAMDLVKGF